MCIDLDAIYAEGWRDYHRLMDDCPYHSGSKEYEMWHLGWEEAEYDDVQEQYEYEQRLRWIQYLADETTDDTCW